MGTTITQTLTKLFSLEGKRGIVTLIFIHFSAAAAGHYR